jgi:capsule polysaccharide export protein KpsE/RkpR
VKAFRFRLDQALRWRATQVDLEKSRAAVAATRLANLRARAEASRRELKESPPQLTTGSELQSLAIRRDRMRRQILDIEKQAKEAEQALAERMKLLVEANRKHLLLENLRQTEQARWQSAFTRELEAFAGEAFLGRLQSKSGRARSSGG